MSQQITLRVRPGDIVRFPNRCVACGQPASEHLTLKKRRGQITRKLDAPLCNSCDRQLTRRSGEEERRLALGRIIAGVVGIALLGLGLVAIDLTLWLRFLLALALGGSTALVIYQFARRQATRAELPEKAAIRRAATIDDFSWRDVTLGFVDAEFADDVAAMNSPANSEAGSGTESLEALPKTLNV
jgi:hypothetical protein